MREYIHFFENSDLRDTYEHGSDYTEPYVSYTPVLNEYKAQFNGKIVNEVKVKKIQGGYKISVPGHEIEEKEVLTNSDSFYFAAPLFIFPEDLNLTEESTEFTFNGITYSIELGSTNAWHVTGRNPDEGLQFDTIVKIDIVSISSTNTDFVHYNLGDRFNGHKYVDLGLPSGTLWATMNVGAENVTDTGLYFAWGETEGYTTSQVPNDKEFSWNDYKYGSFNSSDYRNKGMTKYNGTDDKTVLDLEDDAAHINMGGDWNIPDVKQLKELITPAFVTHEIVSNYQDSGVNGILFTSVRNNNKLFFPFTGTYLNGSLETSISNILSNAIHETYQDIYYYQNNTLAFDNEGYLNAKDSTERCNGCSVRGVIDGYTVSQIQIESRQYSSSDEGYRITLTEPIDSNATNIRLCVTFNMGSEGYVEYPLTSISEDVNLFIQSPRTTCSNLDIKYELDGKTYLINGWEASCIE